MYQRLRLLYVIIILGLLIYLLSSCGCNYHLKQAEKKCGYSTTTEVVTIHDTIYTNRVVKDTIFSFTNSVDTVVLKQDNLQIKYYYNNHDSTVYIKGECKIDTIYKDRIVTVNSKTLEFSVSDYIRNNLIWIIIVLIIASLIIYILKR